MRSLSQILSGSKSLPPKSSRMIHNFKITLLSLLITLLVFHGSLTSVNAPGPSKTKREAAAARAIFQEMPEKEQQKADYWDPAVPFLLGPKISNWDEQRALWNQAHPRANVTRSGKARVLLVSGSQPKPCATPMGSFQLLKSLKNKADYCRLHDIELFYNVALLDPHMTSFWAKLPLLRKLMLAHPEVEWLWWMDSDALFTDMSVEVPFSSYDARHYNLVLNGNEDDVYTKKSWLGMNAGVFLIRNCQWSLDLFDVWAQMGPEGPVRNEAGKLLAATLSDRPDFEGDDQSALVHLLSSQREKWGGKVLLESSLGLHGYWVMIVEKFEEMMAAAKEGSKPGMWPFVTHFVGCKPCGKDGTGSYAVDRCLQHMDRAFNFADNQVLELYGYRHTTLDTHAVHRVRTETSDPLRLLHGSS